MLHIESHGQGRPLILLHGWGMHGGVWRDVVPPLAAHFTVHCVDLPGHGFSPAMNGSTLDSIVSILTGRFDAPATVCGWSLGGQIALRWAERAPEEVARLILVSSTPSFVNRDDWPFGIAHETLQQFSASLEQDYKTTLRRFLALQLRGSHNERELLQILREHLFSRSDPDLASLRWGLNILRDTDLRAALPAIAQPALVIAGGRDKLTPPEASARMAQALPHARLEEIGEAAHAPFLSHPEIFTARLTEFLHE
jgi:pimeloyl-[acyl-carrier protein] methyl ester esterase